MQIEHLSEMLDVIAKDRGIPKEALVEAVKTALASAVRKKLKGPLNLEVEISDTGGTKIFDKKKVVKEVVDPELEISLEDAKKIKPKVKVDEELIQEVTPEDFGRLAAQTAKQVIIQRIREAEKDTIFDDFSQKIGQVLTGQVQRKERGSYLVNLGKVETLLMPQDQIPGENLRNNDHVKLYISDVRKTPRGPVILGSRSAPELVSYLFRMEIPEFDQGILEIKSVVREAGRRSKVAVLSNDKSVAAVGTCVGHGGNRIQNIVRELGSERIDIVEWSDDPKTYISHALSPAKIIKIDLDETEKAATVKVAEDQLSLAIGKEGQNVRLASKLTGWKINIVGQTAEEAAKQPEASASVKESPGKKKTRKKKKE